MHNQTRSVTCRHIALLIITQPLFAAHAADLRTVILSSDVAPIGTPGQFFGFLGTPSINAIGQTTFASYLVNGSYATYNAIWSDAGGNGLHLVAQQDLPPSDWIDGGTFQSFYGMSGSITSSLQYGVPISNSNGTVVFQGAVSGRSGIWTENSGITRTIAASNQPAVGFPGAEFQQVFQPPLLNTSGKVVFQSSVGTPSTPNQGAALFEGSSALSPRLVAGGIGLVPIPGRSNGDSYQMPPNGPSVDSTTPYVLNNAGQIAFTSPVQLTSANYTGPGVWLENAAGEIHNIVIPGDPAPGSPGEVWMYAPILGINDDGELAIRAAAGVRSGIWVGHGADDLHSIVRSGDIAPRVPLLELNLGSALQGPR